MKNSNLPTPHNSARNGEIAKTVIMSGDPLRAKFISENWLTDVVEYNHVRGMLGFTGKYKGKKISVQGHGMGIPSIGIYTYELFNFYGVEKIIRVGSAGGVANQIALGDIIVAMNVCTDSAYMKQYQLPGTFLPGCSFQLLQNVVKTANCRTEKIHVGTILSSDMFYNESPDALEAWRTMGVLGVEMETLGLYCNALRAGKDALCITTVSDLPLGEGEMSIEERQKGFARMIDLALESVLLDGE